jgi:hypothetical protein
MLNTKLSYKLAVTITKQDKRFVAYTPMLDISTSGKTEKQAKQRFVELANLFLEEIFVAGTADDVLSELGWKKVKKQWTPPRVVSSEFVGLRVPTFA